MILLKEQIVMNPLPGEVSSSREDWLLTQGRQEVKATWISLSPTDTLCHKLSYLPAILLSVVAFSLSIICSPFGGLHLHSPSPIESESKFSNLTTFLEGVFTFFSDTPVHIILKMNEFIYLFSC